MRLCIVVIADGIDLRDLSHLGSRNRCFHRCFVKPWSASLGLTQHVSAIVCHYLTTSRRDHWTGSSMTVDDMRCIGGLLRYRRSCLMHAWLDCCWTWHKTLLVSYSSTMSLRDWAQHFLHSAVKLYLRSLKTGYKSHPQLACHHSLVFAMHKLWLHYYEIGL